MASISITGVTATNHTSVKVTFSAAVLQLDPSSDNDALNPGNYAITGGPRVLEPLRIDSTGSSDSVVVIIEEMVQNQNYTMVVATAIEGPTGDPVAANSTVFTGSGDKPKILTVNNPSAGILQIDFSESMLQDGALLAVGTYVLTPAISTSLPIMITNVSVLGSLKSRVTLQFTGGTKDAWYTLVAAGVKDSAYNTIDSVYSSFLIQLSNPLVDELFEPETITFNTNMGAINLNQSTISKRSVEDLVIMRIKDVGHHEQFALIASALQASGVTNDKTKLKLFKG